MWKAAHQLEARPCFRAARAVAATLGLVLAAGCVTPMQQERTRRQLHEREDLLLLQEELRRMSGRIEALEAEQRQSGQQLARAGLEAERSAEGHRRAVDDRLLALDRRIEEVDRARQNDRKEVVDALSKRMAEALRQTAPRAPRRGGAGYEHEVKAGETLSEIAAAYRVTVRAIVDANNLSDPDRLRAGQKVFIPE